MTATRLRQWRGVKPVAAAAGVATTTRLRLTPDDADVLGAVADHVSRVRRADLAYRCRAGAQTPADKARRKRLMTADTSSRMAGTIQRGNDEQFRLARMAQKTELASLRAAVSTLTERITAVSVDKAPPPTLDATGGPVKANRRRGRLSGYRSQAERASKQQRLQTLTARLARVEADHAAGVVHVVAGGKRLAQKRHNLDDAGLTVEQWNQRWDRARDYLEANGSRDEPHGNLTITVTPAGQVSIRLPGPLEHLANAPRGRYLFDPAVTRAVFAHRGLDWAARVTTSATGTAQAVSYRLWRQPERAGWYLSAAWSTIDKTAPPVSADEPIGDLGRVAGVDLNDGHLAVRRLDVHGNPVAAPARIEFDITGTSSRRDAQVRHAITRLIRHCALNHIDTIAVEDLNFADARATGRETMGRGARGKTFRRTVAGIPTAVFRNRLAAMVAHTGLRLIAVNPAYTSQWGAQHWAGPYEISRHEAAATVIGRRAQGHRARRRKGVTRTRPADRVARATNQAEQRATAHGTTGSRHRNRTQGNKSCTPHRPERGNRTVGQPLPRQPVVNTGHQNQ